MGREKGREQGRGLDANGSGVERSGWSVTEEDIKREPLTSNRPMHNRPVFQLDRHRLIIQLHQKSVSFRAPTEHPTPNTKQHK